MCWLPKLIIVNFTTPLADHVFLLKLSKLTLTYKAGL